MIAPDKATLIDMTVILTATGDNVLPDPLGRACYAEILQNLDKADPGLGEVLHDGNGLRPLTCSGLLDYESRHVTRVQRGREYGVRITGLTLRVTQALRLGLLNEYPLQWMLGGAVFQAKDVVLEELSDYESVAAKRLLSAGKQVNKVKLRFNTPTAFKSNGMQMPLPTGDLVFGSLLDRWNEFSPIMLRADVRSLARDKIGVSAFRIESHITSHKQGSMRIGSVGDVAYSLFSQDPYWRAVFQMLADFAKFSGVGVQTTSGMGQVRRVG